MHNRFWFAELIFSFSFLAMSSRRTQQEAVYL